ncbi:hypothetical protein HSBAA_24390 [Vreelandella sulfidaeris]|uniref:DUF1043 domain-containing protein n=1 Tax=Vreelandella sulfidaeris TaxID=115553 RepID=A0A455U7G0_9GAMM|nr:hypothetical protein HSBAA_24390 [Halomonas sulfidaeris]
MIGFIVGLIVGMVAYRLLSKSQREAASMRQKLLEREHQIAEMKSSVGSHLNGIYQRLNNIREEASQLELQLKEDAAEWNIRDAAIQPSLDLSGINSTPEQQATESTSPPPCPATTLMARAAHYPKTLAEKPRGGNTPAPRY